MDPSIPKRLRATPMRVLIALENLLLSRKAYGARPLSVLVEEIAIHLDVTVNAIKNNPVLSDLITEAHEHYKWGKIPHTEKALDIVPSETLSFNLDMDTPDIIEHFLEDCQVRLSPREVRELDRLVSRAIPCRGYVSAVLVVWMCFYYTRLRCSTSDITMDQFFSYVGRENCRVRYRRKAQEIVESVLGKACAPTNYRIHLFRRFCEVHNVSAPKNVRERIEEALRCPFVGKPTALVAGCIAALWTKSLYTIAQLAEYFKCTYVSVEKWKRKFENEMNLRKNIL